MNIIHIVYRDKFTIGYIHFMQYYFNQYHHSFITFHWADDSEVTVDADIILLKKRSDLVTDSKVKKKLSGADKIIVTGVFASIQDFLVLYGDCILKKTYFQFWGGDFYKYRNCKITGVRSLKSASYDRWNLIYCIKHCAGIINLIPSDWDEFYKLFPYDVKHFVAPMPSDPNQVFDYGLYRRKAIRRDTCRILVGNSATETNCHIDAFEKIKVYANEDVEIVVPLSYGDTRQYRETVIEKGTQIFGSKFRPITDFISKEEYIDLLNTCDVGVFNNNRQQGMGNISIMLYLGKKIFARPDTAMWKDYRDNGILLYNINDIPTMSYEQFKFCDEKILNDNIEKAAKRNSVERKIKLWKKVMEDNL